MGKVDGWLMMRRLAIIAIVFVALLFSTLPVVWATETSQGTAPWPTPTPAPVTNKRGSNLCGVYEGCIAPTCADFDKLQVSWVFGWGPSCRADCPGIEGVAMINNLARVQWYDLSRCSPWLLTLNEPDNQGGNGASTPDDAAVAWRQIELYYPYNYLIAPGIMWYETANCWWSGDTCRWLEDWYSAFVDRYGRPPRINALGGHCYAISHPSNDSLTACKAMVTYLDDLAAQWGVTGGHWINEFGPYMYHPQEVMDAQLKETVFFLNRHPTVARYAVWTLRTVNWMKMNTLECWGDELTSYGEIYRDAEVYEVVLPVIGR